MISNAGVRGLCFRTPIRTTAERRYQSMDTTDRTGAYCFLVASCYTTRMRVRSVFVLCMFCACGGVHPSIQAEVAAPRLEHPRLVISVIYDQLASWVLERHLAHLDENGAIRTAIRRGVHIERSRYPYSGTFTAPGHAFTYTGVLPFASGVSSNRVWDRTRHARLSTMDDGRYATLGRQDAFASPRVLLVDGVADAVSAARAETPGTHTVVSLAMKDRSAILPGGHHADAALWFDIRAGGFTTSRYYADALPLWVADFNARHPVASLASWVWTPLPHVDMSDLGADAQSGEGGYGLDASFPHELAQASDTDALLAAPQSTAWLMELAHTAIDEMHLGEDEGTDFLALSIASTDYVGHAFGPMSWECRDNLVRVDAALGELIRYAESRTSVAVLITADHGIAPLVERAHDDGHADATRFSSESMSTLLESSLREHYARPANDEPWVEAWVQPYVYFSDAARTRADFADVLTFASSFLETQPGVLRAIRVTDGERLRASTVAIEHDMGFSIDERAGGNLFIMPREWSVAVEDADNNTGTAHGSPWAYDREVPVLIFGTGISARCHAAPPMSQGNVAPTIAALLGVSLAGNPLRSDDVGYITGVVEDNVARLRVTSACQP